MDDKLAALRRPPARILDWWAHTGAGRPLLQARFPQAALTSVEPTEQLLVSHRPSRRWTGWLRKSTAPALREADVPPGEADMLWANMVLHGAPDPLATMARWRDALAIDGVLMFSCFGPDTARELAAVYGRAGWSPMRHDLQDMHDIGDQLVQAGFADPVMDMERLTLTWRDPAQLLSEVRGWGGNLHPARFAGLRTPRWRKCLLQDLEALRRPDGTLALTIELIYGHAVRPVPRPRVQAQTSVSVDELRAIAKANRSQAHRS